MEDLLDFWKVLNKNNVIYIMAGSLAVRLNGCNSAIDDFHLWLKDTPENRKSFRKTYAEAGYGDYQLFETMEFEPGWTQLYLADGIILAVITYMKGLEDISFDECYARAGVADLDGVLVPFLHINGLLANKKAVARPKDQLDVLELEKIKKYLDEQSGQ